MPNVYVITGGSGGMGKEIAKRLGHKGTILLADIREENLQSTVKELQAEGLSAVEYQTLDITNKEQVDALAQRAEALGDLKAIIHTAGLSPTMADSRRITQVNLVGTGYILDAFLAIAKPGSVAICVSSMSGHMVPREGPYVELLKNPLASNIVVAMEPFTQGSSGAAYSLSKLGVLLIVEDQAWEWGQKGARIVSVSPGTINTPMGRQEADNQEQMKILLQNTPLQREGAPSEIASVVDFLCSDDSSYITGTDIRVDGGTVANMQRLNAQRSH
ncbi:SDR family oxidoreductase [Paenibacillus mendelii]|uniref:SDR family oxidoreductase n=1 Tax=Paenibacillus mendelii TaxID=206163 RepID=A0ABV6JL96_9BACL|nr:SDR family oxidoreductase [Paenibacillus mendelii]MCQ6560569.1 SDR family oxidoreductase [Paenibacillus mendelii]